MARLPRIKALDEQGWYHLHSRVAGVRGDYPLAEPACRRKLIELLRHFTSLYCCAMAAFCVMGNHWHAVIHFQAPFPMNNDDLLRIARKFYPGKSGEKKLAAWNDEQWKRFAARIFDVSEFMRNLQASFARWYNRTHNRQGRFWAGRFGSVLLEDERSVLDCMLYIELNPVRAGIATLPEDYQGSSEYLRSIGKSDWLMDIGRILHADSEKQSRREYRHLLYWRGTERTRENQAVIPKRVAREEEKRGYKVRGIFRKRIAHLTEGVVLGSSEFVNRHLTSVIDLGHYLRRRNPIRPCDSPHCVLRPQRRR
jgi:hypothetical protein